MGFRKTILSLEQALTLPYATQRFVQLGWRVIRLESAADNTPTPGDPNRYIGEETGEGDRHAYFIAPNIGKEAITINLKTQRGRDLLKEIIASIPIDVFMCNTLPKGYKKLGIDFDTLKLANPNLIWCGISAMGPDYPDFAGYDPALQALSGYMHLTGDPEGDPMLCGLPLIDLKAGDEAFSQVLLAILEQHDQPGPKEINISMVQCAASWLITSLPQISFADPSKWFTRSANEHRSFIPSNAYPTSNGFVYLAIGSDSQWKKLCEFPGFKHLDKTGRETNDGRKKDKEAIYADIREGLKRYTSQDFIHLCRENHLAVAPVNNIEQVSAIDPLKQKMMKTTLPDSRTVSLVPPAVDTTYMKANNYTFNCAPGLGEHNHQVLAEAGVNADEINNLENEKII